MEYATKLAELINLWSDCTNNVTFWYILGHTPHGTPPYTHTLWYHINKQSWNNEMWSKNKNKYFLGYCIYSVRSKDIWKLYTEDVKSENPLIEERIQTEGVREKGYQVFQAHCKMAKRQKNKYLLPL